MDSGCTLSSLTRVLALRQQSAHVHGRHQRTILSAGRENSLAYAEVITVVRDGRFIDAKVIG